MLCQDEGSCIAVTNYHHLCCSVILFLIKSFLYNSSLITYILSLLVYGLIKLPWRALLYRMWSYLGIVNRCIQYIVRSWIVVLPLHFFIFYLLVFALRHSTLLKNRCSIILMLIMSLILILMLAFWIWRHYLKSSCCLMELLVKASNCVTEVLKRTLFFIRRGGTIYYVCPNSTSTATMNHCQWRKLMIMLWSGSHFTLNYTWVEISRGTLMP